jgi:hypothetical protein
VFLGADTNIKVDFKPVRRATNTSTSLFLSKTKHQLTTHVTLVKNLKAEKVRHNLTQPLPKTLINVFQISLTIFDQLPLSEDDKIKVKLIDPEIIKVLDPHKIEKVKVTNEKFVGQRSSSFERERGEENHLAVQH